MYWQDQEDKGKQYVVPDEVMDLSFKVQCRQLPLDHAYDLSRTIQVTLPWIAEEPLAGIHLIHGAESGNGWIRPQEPDALLSLSRRTRFMLRLPKHRIPDAMQIAGKRMQVGEHEMILSQPQEKLLSPHTTIFARYIVTDHLTDEEAFLEQAYQWLKDQGIQATKMMSGRAHVLRTPEDNLATRSLMIDSLDKEESVHLQQRGLGRGRKMGCGLFLPHKGIDAVRQSQEK
ncbi:MAG: type I-MYXAN CRISPR-associated protein Cas6/Cmx6 [Gammaproteobacteria bacterium]|nr:type I-MYXAN CRISPR-associated protein Cas6/Cmx6 [Gammaproteobacteria bacterium]